MAASGQNSDITLEITPVIKGCIRECMRKLLGSSNPYEANEAMRQVVAAILKNRNYLPKKDGSFDPMDGKMLTPAGVWPPPLELDREPGRVMAFYRALSGLKPWHVDVVITEGLASRHFTIYVSVPKGNTMFGVEVEEHQPLTGRVKHYSQLWRFNRM